MSNYLEIAEYVQRHHDRVITRHTGYIPDCVPAVDILIEREISQVRAYLSVRTKVEYWDYARLAFLKNPAPKSASNLYLS